MKTVSKKLLSIMLAAILLVSAIPFQAFADGCAHTNVEKDLTSKSEPTCYTDGQKANKVCLDCGAIVEAGMVLPATGAHTFGTDGKCTTPGCPATCPHTTTTVTGAAAADCTNPGNTGNTVCSACGAVVAAGTVIPATGHSYAEVAGTAVAATCTTAGKAADQQCSKCGDVITGATINATGHAFLNGYCTTCGVSDPDAHKSSHTLSEFKYDAVNHWKVCKEAGCPVAAAGTPIDPVPHTFDPATGKCACGYQCPHGAGFTDKPGTRVEPTCVKPGKDFDQYCATCGFVHSKGAELSATGAHTYNDNDVCTVCGAKKPASELTLTLDANGGKVNGGNTMGVSVKKNYPISVMPAPVREGFNFVGWFLVDQSGNMTDTQLRVGQNYPYDTGVTVMAKWADKTQVLTVRRVLNGDNSTAKTIYTANVPEGTPLLDYLKANVAALVNAEVALTPGYSWENNYWRDYSGKQPLTSQKDTMNQAQTVYVNFVSNSYRLYFDANGGTVSRTSQAVTFGKKVGELPTPFKDGSVFMGWKDASGKVYTAKTVYKVAGDTSLTAMWQDEALVILYIYVNGDFSTCNRMIAMDQYVVKNNISRSDVFAEVAKYYTPASGTLKIAGLFDENTWSSYRLNTSKAGTENIEVNDQHLNKIFVMVSNANTGTTVLPTTPSNTVPANGFWVRDLNGNLTWYPAGSKLPAGTGYWVLDSNGNPNIWVMTSGSIIPTYIYVGTNPKTGDTAKIEIAAAIMVLAAAALVTVMALRKKKKSV